MDAAGLVLAVFDGASPLDSEDLRLLEQIGTRPAVAVINKGDLPEAIDAAYIQARVPHTVRISAAAQRGVAELTEAVAQVLGTTTIQPDEGMLFTERQRQAATRARNAVAEALDALYMGMTFDAITVSVEDGIGALLELTGESVSESVVDAVFSQFCVGK
jgi:tRNA modification GTPase